jgi:hypothetical protein
MQNSLDISLMPSACIKVLMRPPYYGHVMKDALREMGYTIAPQPERYPKPGDVLVIWNRHPRDEKLAALYEKCGGKVIVVENGYFGRNFNDTEWYAMALGHHNGGGSWPDLGIDRWHGLGVPLKPWRRTGEDIVILATRHMGSTLTREPTTWMRAIEHNIRKRSARNVRIRPHPGPQAAIPKISLEDDLANAHAAVTWGSSAGLKAIAMGVPVFSGFSKWIGAACTYPVTHDLEDPWSGDRESMFRRVASAMWPLADVENGKAFAALLGK